MFFISSVSSLSFLFLFLPCLSLSSPLLSLLSVFFLSLGDSHSAEIINHISEETLKRETGKQCRARSDARERGVRSGSSLFALCTGIVINHIIVIINNKN